MSSDLEPSNPDEPDEAIGYDPVTRPAHYAMFTIEVIDAIESWGLDRSFCLGNCIKYIARHQHKGAPLEDLRKAAWYLDRAIRNLEKAEKDHER